MRAHANCLFQHSPVPRVHACAQSWWSAAHTRANVDKAVVRTSVPRTAPFLGCYSQSIPQCIKSDVYPLCEIIILGDKNMCTAIWGGGCQKLVGLQPALCVNLDPVPIHCVLVYGPHNQWWGSWVLSPCFLDRPPNGAPPRTAVFSRLRARVACDNLRGPLGHCWLIIW